MLIGLLIWMKEGMELDERGDGDQGICNRIIISSPQLTLLKQISNKDISSIKKQIK